MKFDQFSLVIFLNLCMYFLIATFIRTVIYRYRYIYIDTSLHYSILFVLFCYTKLSTDPHVYKDFFLFDFLAKVVYHVLR